MQIAAYSKNANAPMTNNLQILTATATATGAELERHIPALAELQVRLLRRAA